MRGNDRVPVPAWTQHDAALWHTCEIASDLAAGRMPTSTREVLAPFPPRLGPGERFWASGGFDLLRLQAAGDGSYMHSSGMFFATGAVGLAATAAFAVGQAAGNRSRREAAAAATVPQWTVVDQGELFVSAFGFYLQSQGIWPWQWAAVNGAQMVAPRQVELYGDSEGGPVHWIVTSDWAELLFITWALTIHPRHPQLIGGGWLPPGWLQHCATHGYGTRLTSAALTR